MKIKTHIALLRELQEDFNNANNNYFKDIKRAFQKYFNYMHTLKQMEKESE
jgi:hypothetical protein